MGEKIKFHLLFQQEHAFPLDIADLAQRSGVKPEKVYHMLVRQPVLEEEAQRVLAILSTPERSLTLENVDVILWKNYVALFLVRVSFSRPSLAPELFHDEFILVYAKDRDEVDALISRWRADFSYLPDISYIPLPDGIRVLGGDIFLPGRKNRTSGIPSV